MPFVLVFLTLDIIMSNGVFGQCDGSSRIIQATREPRILSVPGNLTGAGKSHVSCLWTITPAEPSMRILISVHQHNLSCIVDWLKVTAPGLMSPSLCGDSDVPRVADIGANVTVNLTIATEVLPKIFKLWYLGSVSSGLCRSKMTLTPTAEPQYLMSPRFPLMYPSLSTCEWELISPLADHDILLEVLYTDLDIEGNICLDYIRIVKYFRYLLYQKTICSRNNFDTKTYQASRMKVIFHSDFFKNCHGFLLRYSLIESPNQVCNAGVSDLVFLVDSSTSVGHDNFRIQLAFIKEVTSRFVISSDGLRVSIVTFSDMPINQFWLDEHLNTSSSTEAITSITYTGGGTETAKALRFVESESFCACKGSRPLSTKTLVILTDGRSVDPPGTILAVKMLHEKLVNVVAIGIANYDERELETLASHPRLVFKLATFGALTTILGTLTDELCSIAAVPTSNALSTLSTSTITVTKTETDRKTTATSTTPILTTMPPTTISTTSTPTASTTTFRPTMPNSTTTTLTTTTATVAKSTASTPTASTTMLKLTMPNSTTTALTTTTTTAATSSTSTPTASTTILRLTMPNSITTALTSTTTTNIVSKQSIRTVSSRSTTELNILDAAFETTTSLSTFTEIMDSNKSFSSVEALRKRKIDDHSPLSSPVVIWAISIGSIILSFLGISCCCFWILVCRRRRRRKRQDKRDLFFEGGVWEDIGDMYLGSPNSRFPIKYVSYTKRQSRAHL